MQHPALPQSHGDLELIQVTESQDSATKSFQNCCRGGENDGVSVFGAGERISGRINGSVVCTLIYF